MAASTKSLFWYNDDHRAWSANDVVRQECIAIQKRNDQFSIFCGTIGIIFTIVFTIINGDWGNFLVFLLIFAGLIMILGNVRGT